MGWVVLAACCLAFGLPSRLDGPVIEAAQPMCLAAGGLQEALTDVYNDDLRRLREAGVSEAAPEVREAVKACRDEDRSVEGSPQVGRCRRARCFRQKLSPPWLQK